MVIEKLPDEKSFGGDAGLFTLPHAVTEMRRMTPAARKILSAIKVDLAQAAGGSNHTSNCLAYLRGGSTTASCFTTSVVMSSDASAQITLSVSRLTTI